VILTRLGGLRGVDPLLGRLLKYQDEIGRLRRHLEVVQRWTKQKDSLTEASAKTWTQLEEQITNKLRLIENEFWELNVPDSEERARLRILEGLAYDGQKEGLERDLSDLLTDDRFPQVNTLGSGLKRQRSESLPSVPKRGPVLARLGDSVPTPADREPDKQRAVFKAVATRVVEDQEDQPKGKEPQVSRAQSSTRNSQSQSDLSAPGGEQDRRARHSRLNPQRCGALREKEGFDTRAPRGAPRSREEVDTSRRARTKEKERARRAEPKGSRVTNGPPERDKVTPPDRPDGRVTCCRRDSPDTNPGGGTGRSQGPGSGPGGGGAAGEWSGEPPEGEVNHPKGWKEHPVEITF
jgi:hypothetical protein